MLTRQNEPIRLIEFWTSPDGTMDFRYVYYGCWFTRLGYQTDAKGDRKRKAHEQDDPEHEDPRRHQVHVRNQEPPGDLGESPVRGGEEGAEDDQ